MLGLKLNHVSKRGHSRHIADQIQIEIISSTVNVVLGFVDQITFTLADDNSRDIQTLREVDFDEWPKSELFLRHYK